MKILIACEYSGRVRNAFLKMGHQAMSCDLLATEIPGPHYQGDVRGVLNLIKWDMLIAFPPCTYLSTAGGHLWKYRQREIGEAMEFFKMLFYAHIPRVAVENPQGWQNNHWRKPTQYIHPYLFGEPWLKRTCLWLRGLPPLQPTNVISRELCGHWIDSRYACSKGKVGKHRDPKERARTFQGVADAMAAQWGAL